MLSLLRFFVFLLPLFPFLPSASSRHKVAFGTKIFKLDLSNSSSSSNGFDPSKAIQLSWHPRIFIYKNFLSDEECDHLISLAQGKLEKLIIDSTAENVASSNTHAGSEILVSRGQDSVVSEIEERLSMWTFLPKENGENMRISHYGVNESYEPHHDYYHDESKLAYGGNRVSTVLMYLSNVSKGGETFFPQSQLKETQIKDQEWSDCAATSYAVKPVRGSALLLFNLHPDATPDESSLHGVCAVLDGEIWIARKWIHVRGFSPEKPKPLVVTNEEENCTDEDPNCAEWAAKGECQRNPVYMLGTPDYYGSCRKSCGAC